ncbi:MAG: hypothetical protein OEY59_13955, partial [Deltaproteobacteria bacterium]|nr:hypothetical protein [Deltaproteobacteria bacterium]
MRPELIHHSALPDFSQRSRFYIPNFGSEVVIQPAKPSSAIYTYHHFVPGVIADGIKGALLIFARL